MLASEPEWETDPVAFLIHRRFPIARQLSNVKKSGARGLPIGLSLGEVGSLETQVSTYRRELEKLPQEKLSKLIETALQEDAEQIRKKEAEREAQYLFNSPTARADFDYWAKASSWTIDECVALSMERDPRSVTWEMLHSLTNVSKTAKEFANRRLLFQRAVGAEQMFNYTLPGIAIAWMERMKIDFPPELKRAVQDLGIQVGDWKSLYDQVETRLSESLVENREMSVELEDLKSRNDALASQLDQARSGDSEMNQREKNSLLRIVYGIACEQYDFDGRRDRNKAPSQIENDLALVGIELGSKTIRKYLKEGYELFGKNANF